MITLGPALFDNNNRLITLSGGYKNLHCLTLNLLTTTVVAPPSNASKWQMGFNSAFKGLTQFIVTTFYMYKKQQNLFINN